MNRSNTSAHLAECKALALHGEHLTPAERAQQAQACAKADAEAWQRIQGEPQLELLEAA